MISANGVRITTRTVAPITDKFMASIGKAKGDYVMLLKSSLRKGKRQWNIARRDPAGTWYVRQGKRGGIVCVLESCQITALDGVDTLFQFILKE